MTSKPVSEEEKDVICAICLEQFKDPRMLHCMHTYCKRCLEPLLKHRKTITCPECKYNSKINSVNSLKVNFWVNRFISVLALSKVANKQQNGGQAGILCNNCASNEAAQARCFDCEKYMCSECLSAHRRISELTKDHHVMTLDEIKSKGFPPVVEKLTFCDKHKGKKQKLFCKGCDHLICKDCTVRDHKDHDYHLIVDVIGDYKEKITSEIKTASIIEKKIEASVKSVEKRRESIISNVKETEQHIDAMIDEQIKVLEVERSSLKRDLKFKTETKINNLSSEKTDLEMHQAYLRSAMTFAENALAKGSSSEILSVSKNITSRLSQLSTKSLSAEDRCPLAHALDVDDNVRERLKSNIDKLARVFEFDPLVIDPQHCELVWKSGDAGCFIHIKNAIGEYMNIDERRIYVGSPRNLVLKEKGIWLLDTKAQSHGKQSYTPPSATVKVDGKPIKNGNIYYSN